jgi:HEAT repeat protein
LAVELKNPRVKCRWLAVEALGEFFPYCPAAVSALAAALQDEDVRVCQRAAVALRMYGPEAEPAIARLVDALQSPNTKLRAAAARTLVELGPAARAARPILVQATKDGSYRVRCHAIEALANLAEEDDSLVAIFIEALADPNEVVRVSAVEALQELGAKAKSAIHALLRMPTTGWLRPKVAVALVRCGHDASAIVGEWIAELKSRDTQLMAAKTLSEIASPAPEAEPVLRQMLDKGVRRALKLSNPMKRAIEWMCVLNTAKALWNINQKPDDVVPLLTRFLVGQGLGITREVCDILCHMGPAAKDAVPALVRVLQGENSWGVQSAVAEALCAIGPEARAAIPTLVEALKDPFSAQWAASVLGNIGPEAVPALIQGLRIGDADTRAWTADALGQIGPAATAAVGDLTTLLQDKPPVRWWAAIALAEIQPSPAALPVLIETMQAVEYEQDARCAAAEALGRMGGLAQTAIPLLKQALQDGDRSVREAAHQALQQI